MFVGRDRELASLNRLYRQGRFQMVVVYGRRRIGKTTLTNEFVRGRRSIQFTAQQQSPAENLRGFSESVYRGLGMSTGLGPFSSWKAAFSFVGHESKRFDEPLVVVFDEFPYAAAGAPELPSVLQIAIDQELLETNVFLILCGSNEGFMESEVLGVKSPLYGRRTSQIHLKPFDYLDASQMLPGLSPETLVQTYATFGGTPYYLNQVDASLSYEENVASLMFDPSGLLYEEPLMLLRQELREPSLYNSVLGAIASGATKPKAIAERAGVEQSSLGPYLRTLDGLGLIERRVPFGEHPERSRKGMWRVADPFFAYWYRFVRPSMQAIEVGAGSMAAREMAAGEALSTYVGKRFEDVCMQWVQRANANDALPFFVTSFGQWWGADPSVREEADIDLVAANAARRSILVGECKWRASFDETAAIDALERRAKLVRGTWEEMVFALFSKRETSEGTRAKARGRTDLLLITAADLFG